MARKEKKQRGRKARVAADKMAIKKKLIIGAAVKGRTLSVEDISVRSAHVGGRLRGGLNWRDNDADRTDSIKYGDFDQSDPVHVIDMDTTDVGPHMGRRF